MFVSQQGAVVGKTVLFGTLAMLGSGCVSVPQQSAERRTPSIQGCGITPGDNSGQSDTNLSRTRDLAYLRGCLDLLRSANGDNSQKIRSVVNSLQLAYNNRVRRQGGILGTSSYSSVLGVAGVPASPDWGYLVAAPIILERLENFNVSRILYSIGSTGLGALTGYYDDLRSSLDQIELLNNAAHTGTTQTGTTSVPRTQGSTSGRGPGNSLSAQASCEGIDSIGAQLEAPDAQADLQRRIDYINSEIETFTRMEEQAKSDSQTARGARATALAEQARDARQSVELSKVDLREAQKNLDDLKRDIPLALADLDHLKAACAQIEAVRIYRVRIEEYFRAGQSFEQEVSRMLACDVARFDRLLAERDDSMRVGPQEAAASTLSIVPTVIQALVARNDLKLQEDGRIQGTVSGLKLRLGSPVIAARIGPAPQLPNTINQLSNAALRLESLQPVVGHRRVLVDELARQSVLMTRIEAFRAAIEPRVVEFNYDPGTRSIRSSRITGPEAEQVLGSGC